MSALLLLILSLFTVLATMMCLALAMDKHYRSMFGSELTVTKIRILRATGWLLLVVSLVFCVMQWGAVIGVVAWVGELTIGLIAVVLFFAWPTRLRKKM